MPGLKSRDALTISSLKRFFSLTSPTLEKLLSLKRSEVEEQWGNRAVEVLVKKLRQRNNSLNDLKKALTCPTMPSKCVTIPRSLNGQLQIWFRREFPHVIYCRIWRWPDLASHHELRALDICQHPFSSKQPEVCINPYHYQRVQPIVVPPVLIMTNREIPTNTTKTISPVQQVQESAMPQNVSSSFEEFPEDHDLDDITEIIGNACSLGSLDWPLLDNPMPSNELISDATNMLALTPPPENPTYHTLTTNQEILPQQDNCTNIEQPDFQSIFYEETSCWTSIAYYELNTRVGEMFQSKSNRVNIDGFTDPSNTIERFCLGRLTNVHRNSTIENTRRHIGYGIQFSYIGGEVWVECFSDSAVFVQSKLYNSVHGCNDDTVCKIPPQCSLMVFSNRDFSELLSKRVYEGFGAVYELTKMCTIR